MGSFPFFSDTVILQIKTVCSHEIATSQTGAVIYFLPAIPQRISALQSHTHLSDWSQTLEQRQAPPEWLPPPENRNLERVSSAIRLYPVLIFSRRPVPRSLSRKMLSAESLRLPDYLQTDFPDIAAALP